MKILWNWLSSRNIKFFCIKMKKSDINLSKQIFSSLLWCLTFKLRMIIKFRHSDYSEDFLMERSILDNFIIVGQRELFKFLIFHSISYFRSFFFSSWSRNLTLYSTERSIGLNLILKLFWGLIQFFFQLILSIKEFIFLYFCSRHFIVWE